MMMMMAKTMMMCMMTMSVRNDWNLAALATSQSTMMIIINNNDHDHGDDYDDDDDDDDYACQAGVHHTDKCLLGTHGPSVEGRKPEAKAGQKGSQPPRLLAGGIAKEV